VPTSPRLDALLAAPVPDHLFHYTSVAGFHGIVTSRSVWATAAQYLNDSQEFRLAIDMARAKLAGLASEAASSGRCSLLLYLREQLERLEHYLVCVFSLSEERDLLSQWRAYCPPASGYAVGFRAPLLREVLAAQGCVLAPCQYQWENQERLVAEALDPVVAALPSDPPSDEASMKRLGEDHLPALFERLSRVAPLIKHESFHEEREWRVVWLPRPDTAHRLDYRVGRTMMLPFTDIQLDGSPHGFPLGVITVGPTPHSYIANSAACGFMTGVGVQWQAVRPSEIPYRQV